MAERIGLRLQLCHPEFESQVIILFKILFLNCDVKEDVNVNKKRSGLSHSAGLCFGPCFKAFN